MGNTPYIVAQNFCDRVNYLREFTNIYERSEHKMEQGVEKGRKGVLSLSPSAVFNIFIGLQIPVTIGAFESRT